MPKLPISGPPHRNCTCAERLQFPSPPRHRRISGGNVGQSYRSCSLVISGGSPWAGALLVPVPSSPPRHCRQPWIFPPASYSLFCHSHPFCKEHSVPVPAPLPQPPRSSGKGCPVNQRSFKLPWVLLESQGGEGTAMAVPLSPLHRG